MTEPIAIEKKEIRKLVELNEELENYFRNTIIPQLFIDADLILRKFSPPRTNTLSLRKRIVGSTSRKLPV